MSYVTQEMVEGEFRGIDFSASKTAISTDDLNRFIVEADMEINSRLAVKYATPVTDSNALIIVRRISIKLIKHRIEGILAVKNPSTKIEQGDAKTLRDEALEELADLASGKSILIGATLLTTADGVKSYTSSSSYERKFNSCKEQW